MLPGCTDLSTELLKMAHNDLNKRLFQWRLLGIMRRFYCLGNFQFKKVQLKKKGREWIFLYLAEN